MRVKQVELVGAMKIVNRWRPGSAALVPFISGGREQQGVRRDGGRSARPCLRIPARTAIRSRRRKSEPVIESTSGDVHTPILSVLFMPADGVEVRRNQVIARKTRGRRTPRVNDQQSPGRSIWTGRCRGASEEHLSAVKMAGIAVRQPDNGRDLPQTQSCHD